PLYIAYVTVKVEPIGFDVLLDKMRVDLSTHTNAYDMYTVPYIWLGSVGDFLYPLKDIESKYPEVVDASYDIADFEQILIDTYAMYNGKLIGFPFFGGQLDMFYRSDLFENAEYQTQFKGQYGYDIYTPKKIGDAPLTYQQLYDYAEFFNSKVKWSTGEQYGICLSGKEGDPFFTMYHNWFGIYRRSPDGIAAFGDVNADWGDLFTSDLKPAFDPRINDMGIKALEDYQGLNKFSPGITNLDWVTVHEPFTAGYSAIDLGWGGYWSTFAGEGSPIQGKVAAAPGPGTHLGGWGISINSDTKAPKEAYLFIQFITSKEFQKTLTKELNFSPVRKSVYTDPEVLAASGEAWTTGAALANVQLISVRPKATVEPQLELAFSQSVGKVFLGQSSAKDALTEAADQFIKIMEENQ
ncbi:MAG: extracellular solute-binding protein, partial [Actinobacteria bacterium]|nr:extracellular solute-binding protein [Actinomycetota bacterium]